MNSVVLSYSNVSDSLRLDDNTKNRHKKLYSESSRPDCTHIPPGGILYLPDVDNNVRMVLVVTINSVGGYIPAVFDNYKLAIISESAATCSNCPYLYFVTVYCKPRDDVVGCVGDNISYNISVITKSGQKQIPTHQCFTFTDCPALWELDHDDQHDVYTCKINKQLGRIINCYSDNNPLLLVESQECQLDSVISLIPGYCLSKNNKYYIIIGNCPLGFSNLSLMYEIAHIENENFCRYLRSGRLCGDCVGYGIPINSFYLECVDCTRQSHVPGWVVFIILQMIPLTIMIILIIVLNVKLTIGSANGFLFYNQIMSLVFPSGSYPAWIMNTTIFQYTVEDVISSFYTGVHVNQLSFLPYTIWNLDFINSLGSFLPICITPHMTAVGVISFWYLIALYPLVLLLLLYVWIIMYEKGFRCVVYITRPIHRLLARFWRIFDIEPSFIYSIASIYVLCFTQFTVISVKLLQFSKWESVNNSDTGLAFYYDGTLDYFGRHHIFYGIMAIIIFILVVLLPTLYLVLYPFKWFHRLLDFCKLRREGLIAVSDVFTGPYKHGADNTADCRIFSSFYFILRIVIISSFSFEMHSSGSYIGHSFQLAISILTAGIIMIFRPYKRNIHNFVEFMIFLTLAAMAGACVFSTSENAGLLLLINSLGIMHIPYFFAIGYFFYWVYKKHISCCRYWRNMQNAIPMNDFNPQDDEIQPLINDDDCVFADRINNPNDYDEHHERNVPYDPVSCTTRTQTNGTSSTVNATYGSINTSRVSTGTGNKPPPITNTYSSVEGNDSLS